MHIISHTRNCNELIINKKVRALFSYETLVGFKRGHEVYKTSEHYSRTTTKHINKYDYSSGIRVDTEILNHLLKQALVDYGNNCLLY